MSVSLVVDVSDRCEDLAEEYSGLILRKAVLCNDVVKQLTTRAVLCEKTTGFKQLHRYKQVITDKFNLALNA